MVIDWESLSSEQLRLLNASRLSILGYIILVTGAYWCLDMYAWESDRIYVLLGFLVWGLGYFLFLSIMQRGGYLVDGKATGIGTYFALSVAIGVPVAFGLIVLVVPGLYLLMRWLPAYSRALVTFDGVGNSMRWSWAQTEKMTKVLALATIGPVVCFGVSLGLGYAYEYLYEYFDWTEYGVASLAWNLAASMGTAWLTIVGVAAYGLIKRNA